MAPLKPVLLGALFAHCISPLHDRKVMAPLKPHRVAAGPAAFASLHDRKVMAPLKRLHMPGMSPTRTALHDRKVMAPLKHRSLEDRHGLVRHLSMTARSWPH